MKCIQGFAQVCSPCGNYGTIWFASAAAPGILLALNKCTTLITERGIYIFQKDLIDPSQDHRTISELPHQALNECFLYAHRICVSCSFQSDTYNQVGEVRHINIRWPPSLFLVGSCSAVVLDGRTEQTLGMTASQLKPSEGESNHHWKDGRLFHL